MCVWKWKSLSCVRLFATLWLYSPWNSPGQNTGVGSLSLLQGIFPTQGSNLGLLHCRQILYQLSHKGSPSVPEWVIYLFSSGFSWPSNWARVSCIAGGLFTNWAIGEACTHAHVCVWVCNYPSLLDLRYTHPHHTLIGHYRAPDLSSLCYTAASH